MTAVDEQWSPAERDAALDRLLATAAAESLAPPPHHRRLRRVAQMPGPDAGTVMSVWTARSEDGTVCVVPLYEAPGPLDRPVPNDFRLSGGVCLPPDPRAYTAGLGGSSTDQGIHTQRATIPGAVRAELRLADGTMRATLAAEGMFFY